ncbi:MAG: hypothetical protein GF317_16895 [Candidatus Lokiarchaeota archaeon]|nr:hypothetical protein [Candidatus Lokiarchaeota archaeon]MBD3201196.1 hypothetical protein [Candidatus Lokiarchaeota archaeon]
MLELVSYNEKVLNTKDRVTIDLIKEGEEFLREFDINHELLPDTVSLIYRYLRKTGKIPHNLYKFYIAAYYIISRHPRAFPVHESKGDFCEKYGLKPSSLDYSVEKLVLKLDLIKILDDMNYPYFIDPNLDIGLNLTKKIIKSEIDKAMMNFLLCHQPLDAQILSEELTTKLIFEMNLFPEELFRQFFELVNNTVVDLCKGYYEYAELQQKYFF